MNKSGTADYADENDDQDKRYQGKNPINPLILKILVPDDHRRNLRSRFQI